MSPTSRTGALVAAEATLVLVAPAPLVIVLILALLTAAVVDALLIREPPRIERLLPHILSRGIPTNFGIEAIVSGASTVEVRQPAPADISIDPSEGHDSIQGEIIGRRRGRHVLVPTAVRATGPLGLGRRQFDVGESHELLVYPDLVSARRLALSFRQDRFRASGVATRGPLGLGTEFESIRDYLPDDDMRQINWQASARLGRPMTNQYRLEQDRDVICVIDAGRLMSAPIGNQTRLDLAVDATAAVCLVADEVGDRCGAVAFHDSIIKRVTPRRRGADAVIRGIFDVTGSDRDSDYELAFRVLGGYKRALVIVLTDLLEETAARPLLEAVPVLARKHNVVIASSTDPHLAETITTTPHSPLDVYTASVAVEMIQARERAAARLMETGATIVQAPPDQLGAACVRKYLDIKARARI